jgi:hypothetical protein
MYEIGMEIEAWCGQCKIYRGSAIISLNEDGSIDRVTCLYCNTSRNYRPVSEEKSAPAAERSPAATDEDQLTTLIKAVMREEVQLDRTAIGDKWIGGKLILRPGKAGLQEKEVPIDAFFRKIVMLRDRLRVLEQQINASSKLSDPEKIQFQQYITRCYGTLTTFNILFKDPSDQFIGQKGDKEG